MTGASWTVSCAGLVMWALCWLVLQHYHHLHSMAHPIAIRVAIFFSYVAGCAVALTALGSYVLDALTWLLGTVGGTASNGGHAAVEIAALFLLATAAVALVWVPRSPVAYLAAVTPFILALSGGHLHALLNLVPAQQVVEAVSKWIGG